MNRAIIIQDWILEKEYLPANVYNNDGYGGCYLGDFRTAQKCFRVVGTKEQIEAWSAAKDFILDEVFVYEPIEKDSYWDGIVCRPTGDTHLTREEYNAKFDQDYLRYLKMYKDNYSKVLILRIT
tara:strand:- start:4490 stop:4861 length:372 start_codon:yes stop_codon:yes gene_type:complete